MPDAEQEIQPQIIPSVRYRPMWPLYVAALAATTLANAIFPRWGVPVAVWLPLLMMAAFALSWKWQDIYRRGLVVRPCPVCNSTASVRAWLASNTFNGQVCCPNPGCHVTSLESSYEADPGEIRFFGEAYILKAASQVAVNNWNDNKMRNNIRQTIS